MRRASFWSRFAMLILGVLPASLFVGLMFATAGVAVHPPLAFVATPLVCAGEVEVESQDYSYRPGQRGTTRTLWCVAEGAADGKPVRTDITFRAILAAFLVYAAIAFVPLFLLGEWLRRRAAALFRRGVAPVSPDGGEAGAIDLSAILARVNEAVQSGDARVTVRDMSFDAHDGDGPGGDAEEENGPAERLALLQRLRDRGLISAAEYEAKRREILAGL